MIDRFEEGEWYRWAGGSLRPAGWSSAGSMDAMLDGKPRLCTKASGANAAFNGIIAGPFSGEWQWIHLSNFEEVVMPEKGVKYWVGAAYKSPDEFCGEWFYVGTTVKGQHVFENVENSRVLVWKYFTPVKKLTVEDALRACIEKLEAIGDTSGFIEDAKRALVSNE